ncbi:MAG: hypothetical protein A3C84_04985 [Candidatus Ryanbacteria bacterium RIFCSPHIGHO2_02_FULL_48_12]|jgi:predicted nuclease with TOPRIM domain|uniref:Uncharacterized protein n=1 Tax=Candidatus Ryanbacteria bacterium RIFCSPHIGHO2_01_FULL_48_27 TaxID=1802115 RepID=A0A1G2G852_9BACT|nr:MAG: hypothetical protein A2756_06140 [Candidatus Ryanbacteria bacterium RIFCSPHIGHO2_01_FULL_48_27]OGZ49521.1 MAG: hypothetical protein A3C84_04985 [Candidatus Ryanbacteria bacterium RIFCSPHIGHO2_02_FULL_48_12]
MTLTQQDLEAIQKVIKSELLPVEQRLQGEFIPVHQAIKELREDISGLREVVQSLAVSVDKLVKATESLQQEYSLIVSEIKLHETWIRQIAEKVGLKLER